MLEPVDGIKIYNNLIPSELVEKLLLIAKTAEEADWLEYKHPQEHLITKDSHIYDAYMKHKEEWDRTTLIPEDKAIFDLVKGICEDIIDPNTYITEEVYRIKRYVDGKCIAPHYDSVKDFSLISGIVIYLNDDYEGGEIYYSELDFSYKPVAGSVIVHPANKKFTHGINKVIGNTRYSMAFFVSSLTNEKRSKLNK